jgi:hypothetical protein
LIRKSCGKAIWPIFRSWGYSPNYVSFNYSIFTKNF